MLGVMKSYMPARIAVFILGWNDIGLDGRVVLFTIAGALITTVLFGLLPALQSSSLRLVDTLKEGGRSSTAGRLRLRRMLVTAEIALALPLLLAAGMTALGTYRFLNGPQGYDPNGLLTFKLALPENVYPGHAERARFVEDALAAVAAIPGASSAAITNVVPSSSSGWTQRYEIEGEPLPPGTRLTADFRTITPGYFATMRQALTRGRAFTALDTAATQPVAIVSEAFVEKHWPGQDPLGKRVVFPGDTPVTMTVVGVASNYIHDWFNGPNKPTIFRPMAQRSTETMGFVIRTDGNPGALTSAARAAIGRIDANQPIFQVLTQVDQVRERTIGPQYAAGVMALFGVLALLLSAVGIYALVGYYVMQRRQEIGVRMALGAQSGDIVRQTLRQAATMAAVGVGIGAVAAFALGRVLESAMFGIAQSDPRLLAGFAAILTLSALVAGYVPARRAAGIDPMVAMRND
jgi:putative ABC transport system permease protein